MTTTDNLIRRLATEPPLPPFNPRRMALVMVLSIAVPVTLFLLVLGHRQGLAAAWSNPVVPFKTILPLAASAASLLLLLRLARPGARAGGAVWLLAGPGAVAVALWFGAYALRAAPERFAEVSAASLGECLGSILLLSVVPAAVILRVIRQGASTWPRLSGALAGLTAATGATAGYSLFCTRDNPLFFVSWYGAAILMVALVCAALGQRTLRW
ncbi:NrsF family protein [Fuscibacter oryzae]|uniref:DUF1109 domain-containing protein n=1 Tax=Fuscibacter oryzae TaxID=2803939 RepID=A0A8J7SWV1_9RHOB|nr:DUF1109 domain-containing protein [Fuscibacter oryzae]MBL4930061.1 DUF1109 domain-containing protein [Fuscibacter oryzae]